MEGAGVGGRGLYGRGVAFSTGGVAKLRKGRGLIHSIEDVHRVEGGGGESGDLGAWLTRVGVAHAGRGVALS